MALIARIHAAGQSTRVVRLRKGRNRLELKPGEHVEIVDEKTGQAPEAAHAERVGDDLVVTASSATTVVIDGFYAAGSAAMMSLPGTGYAEITPTTSLLACAAQDGSAEAATGAAAGGGGGMSTTALAVLGALAVGGGVAVAASGGKSKGGGQTSNQVPPAAPTDLDLAAADDSGASNSDNLTSQTGALTITGRAEAGSMVQILSGTTVLASGTTTAAGTFSIDITLPEGTTTISARASNSGGAGPASTGLSVTVDTTAPAPVVVGDASGGAVNAGEQMAGVTVALTGLEAGSTRTVTLSGPDKANPGQTLTIAATVDANGNLSLTPETLARFADGSFTISVQQTDVAGNVSTASTASVLLDTVAPTLAITSNSAALEFGQTATLTFTFSEAPTGFAAADVSVTGGTISNLAATVDPKVFTATLTPTLGAAGAIVVTVANSLFTDAAGNAGTGSPAPNISYDPGTSGSGVDGYIAFALVFRDADNDGAWDREAFTDSNNNGLRDANEAFVDSDGDGRWDAERFTTTDANGDFANLGGFGRIVLAPLVAGNGDILTRDISTGAVFTKQFSAPDGSTVLSPLTTLVEAIAGNNASPAAVAAAEAQVKAVLGIDDSVDLRTFDPLAAATAAGADAAAQAMAVEVQKAAVQVANILNVVSTAAAAAEAYGTAAEAAQAAAAALATQITTAAGNGELINLGNSSVVASVVGTVAAASTSVAGAAALNGQSESVSSALATVNEAVASIDSTADVNAALTQVVATQIVAQVDLSAAVSTAITGGGVLVAENYSGTALADKVDSAAAQVEVIIPVAVTPQQLAAPDRPTVDDGTRLTAGELADGINVSVSYGPESGARAGDRLRLMLGGVEVGSVTLTAADIPDVGQTRTLGFAVSQAAIGTDGSKVLTASFVGADASVGPESQPVLLTVDTLSLAPTIDPVSGGAVNAAEAAAGAPVSLGGIEIGASVSAKLVGVSVLDDLPLELDIPRVNNELRLTPQLLGQFKDGTLTIEVSQTDAVGNVSPETTRSFVLDRASPTAIVIDEISGRFISNTEAQAGVPLAVAGIEAGATVLVTVSGTGVAGGTVTQVLPAAGGSYSLSPALLALFADGQLTVTATQTDAAGNSSAVGSQTVQLSRGGGLLPPGIGDVSGGIVNAAEKAAGISFTLSGVEPGATALVSLSGGGLTSPLSILPDVNGVFVIASNVLNTLTDGTLTLTAVQIDQATNTSGADTRTFVLDSTAPNAPATFALRSADDTGASTTDGITNKAVFTVTGTGEAGAKVDVLDGMGAVIKSGIVAANGTFAIEVTRPSGSNSLSARLTDAAGNVGAAGSGIVVIVDTTSPVTLGFGAVAGDNRINATERAAGVVIPLIGVEAGAVAAITIGGNDAAAPAKPLTLVVPSVGGVPTLDAALLARFANGPLTVRATQTDVAGNKSVVATATLMLDTGAPGAPTGLALAAADDTGVSGDGITSNTMGLTITGIAEAGSTVELFAGSTSLGTTTAGTNGAFSLDVSLAEGPRMITAVATDAAGNVSPASAVLNLTVDATAPAVPTGLDLAAADDSGASATDNLTSQTTALTITGVTEPGARVELFSGAASLGVGIAAADGIFSIDVSLPSGGSTITAVSTDLAGNISAPSVALAVTVDADAPAAPMNLDLLDADDTGDPADNLTALSEGLTINGSAEAGSRVELFNGSTSLGVVTADGSGNFTFTNVTLQTGGNSLTARATDAAGNFSASSAPLNVTVDPTLLETRTGTAGDDVLAITPGIGALEGLGGNDTLTGGGGDDGLFGGEGDDTIAGFDGDDELEGDEGNDTVDGGAGDDTVEFELPDGSTGTLRAVQGTGADASSVFIERVDGATVETVFKITPVNNGESYTVTGLGSAASLGTDEVSGVEMLRFVIDDTPFTLFTTVDIVVFNNITNILGSIANDTLDVAVQVPAADAATPVNVSGGFGDDTLTGHAGVNTLGGGAGNDSLSGQGGNDFLEGSAGNDTLDGGTGFDIGRFFIAPPLAGSFRLADGTGGEAGLLFVERVDGATVERLFRIEPTGTGAATVTGLGSAAFLGADMVANVEQLSFQVTNNPFNANQFVRVLLDVLAPAIVNGNAFVNGSVVADTIDLATLYPGAVAGNSIGANGDRGDDTIIGNDLGNGLSGGAGNDIVNGAGGDDYLQGNAGNDMVDGGTGNDTVAFNLPGDTPGSFVVVDGTGVDAGKLLVQRVDGQTVETIFRVTVTGTGAATIEGVNSASSFGSDTVANAEFLDFGVQPFNQAKFARIDLTVRASEIDDTGNAFVSGGAAADTIDLNAIYPANLNGNFGVNAGAGADTITGNAGDNYLEGGSGDDAIDGGAGTDNSSYVLSNVVGTLEMVEGTGADAGSHFVQRVDGATTEQLFRITLTGSGSATVTGLNSAEAFGTDTLSNIEFVNFSKAGSNTGGVGLQIGVTTGVVDNVPFAFGSVQSDTIDIALLYPSADAGTAINANGNRGDDSFVGHAGANRFFGDDGDDTMAGGSGNDELFGGAGADVAAFSGNRSDYTITRAPDGFITLVDNRPDSPDGTDRVAGFDIETLRFADVDVPTNTIGLTLNGTEGSDQLNGSSGPDDILAGGGDDNINGNGGDDAITGGAGNDFISGGGGDDIAVFSGNFADYLIETQAGGAVRVTDTRAGSPDGVDYIANTTDRLQFADQIVVLAGTPGQSLQADNSNGVTLAGGAGDDQIGGGLGDDMLAGNAGDDSLFGGDGNDTLTGNDGDDDLNGWVGDDVLLGGLGNDLLIGEGGNDELIGNVGNDVILGGDGADYARGEEGADFVQGGEGDDILLGGYFGDHVAQPGDEADTIQGLGGNDVLRGGDGNDTLDGGAGDDNLRGDLGDDVLDGGDGIDFVSIRFDALGEFGRTYDHGAGITFDASLVGSAGTIMLDDLRGGTDTLISIEAIGITGTGYDDTLIGGTSAVFSQLTGYGGNDTLVGGTSMDDIAVYTGNFTDYTVVRQGDGTITVTDLRGGSPDGTDTLSSIEALAFNDGGATYRVRFADDINGFVGGTPEGDLLLGDGANNYMRGDGDDDLVNGGAGRDTAAFGLPAGTTGTLQLVDGTGPDAGKLLVQRVDGSTIETLFRVTVNAVGSATVEAVGSAAFLGTDQVANVEQLDFFVDSGVPNTPPAEGQYVGINLAPFVGQLQDNFAFVNGGEAGDQIDLAALYGNPAGANLNANGNRGDDTILGHDGSNFLQGSAGNDTLSGLAGNDGLDGGVGSDTLLGGADNDYLQGNEGNDSIDGGTGSNDVAAFTLPNGTPGTLRTVEGSGADAGKLIIQRVDGAIVEDLFRVTVGNEGEATVEGLGARADFGIDTVTNIDELHFVVSNNPFDPNQFTSVRLTPRVDPVTGGSAFVEGSAANDSIDLAALYPAADAMVQLNSNGNRGNDTIIGHAGINNLQGGTGNDMLNGAGGNDSFEGGAGDDVIDGGADTDFVRFILPAGIAGTLGVRDGMTAGTFVVQRTPQGGGTPEDLFLITMTGPTSATVQGMNAAAFLGTDTVSNVERLEFFVPNAPIFTALNFAPTAFPANGNNPAFVAGSVNADTYDVATFFPAADVFTVVNSNGDRGNDSITGHAGTNTLSGAQGDDQIFGLGGNDTLIGNIGADTLEGGEGDDVLIGGNNAGASAQPGDLGDTLRGGAGFDVLRGGDGDDVLEGGDDDDNLRGDNGSDTIDGGAGRDFVSYRFDDLATAVNFDATQFAAAASFAQDDGRGGTDQLSNVEQLGVSGSQGDDVIRGSEFTTGAPGIGYANQLAGEGGNDQIFGAGSFDRLQGDAGNDELFGGGGTDDLIGGAGDDLLDGGDGIDRAGFSYIASAAGITLDASTFAAGMVTVADGLGGTDTLVSIEAVSVTGSNFADTLTGGAEDDEFEGAGGDDIIVGGAGTDFVYFDGNLDDHDIVRLADGTIRVTDIRDDATNGTDILSGVEILNFLDEDVEESTIDLTQSSGLIGTLDADTLTGTADGDAIYGSDGNDTLRGGDGNDFLSGGAGDDRFDEEQPNGVAGGLGDDLLDGGAGNDFMLDFFGVNEIRGGEGNDTLGGTGDIFGDGGNDIFLYVSSGPSSDRLFGGAGNDIYLPYPAIEPMWVADHIVDFEIGNPMELIGLTAVVDQLTGYAAGTNLFANGFVRYQQSGANVALQIDFDGAANGAMFQDLLILDNLTLTTPTLNALMGRTNLLAGITGNRDANTLNGSANNDFIRAFGGNDTVHGNDGNDNIDGGTGDDTLRGGNGDDILIGEAAFELTAGNDFLLGGAGNDRVDGGGGDDQLRGDDGDDILIGGDGTDLLRGGAGVDSFDGGASDPASNTLGFGSGPFGDRISFFEVAATTGVIADLRTGIISNDGFGNSETMVGIESLGGDTAFADEFYGNDERNSLLGSVGDTQMGFGGDDRLLSSGAGALVDGGDGIDEWTLSTAGYLLPDSTGDGLAETRPAMTAGWTVDLASESVTDGFGDTGTVRNVEIVYGTQFADTLRGSAAAETLDGGAGDDVIDGREGDDTLNGDDGFDTLTGGAGADMFVFDDSAEGNLSLADLITDFTVGVDTFRLDDELTFADLIFTAADNGVDTIIAKDGGATFLAVVQNVAPLELTSASFVMASGG